MSTYAAHQQPPAATNLFHAQISAMHSASIAPSMQYVPPDHIQARKPAPLRTPPVDPYPHPVCHTNDAGDSALPNRCVDHPAHATCKKLGQADIHHTHNPQQQPTC
jgi:hypothetical protein